MIGMGDFLRFAALARLKRSSSPSKPGIVPGAPETFLLMEGDVITIKSAAATAGTVQQNGSDGNLVSTTAVGANQRLQFGPFAGIALVVVTCTAGSMDATVGAAPLFAASVAANRLGTPFRLTMPNGRPVANRRVGRKGKVILDGSDKTQWAWVFANGGGETLAADPVNKLFSAQGLSVNPGTTGVQGVRRTFATTFAISAGAIIRINVYIPPAGYSVNQTYTIKFSSDANASKSLQYTFTNAHIQAGWNTLTVRAGEDGTYEPQAGNAWVAAGGQAWGDNFNYFHIFGGANVANQPWVLDSVTIGARDVPRFVFTTDGTDPSILNVIAPMLASYGWAATAMIDGDAATVNGFAPTAKILIEKYGWEIGIQGITHTSYNTNGRDIGADWDTCTANFLAAGLPAPKVFAYPQNAASVANDAILAAKGCVWRRAGGLDLLHSVEGIIPGLSDGMVRQGCNAHSGQNYNTGTAYTQIKNRLEHLRLVCGVMSSFVHSETVLSTNWPLGGDLSQLPLLLDQLYDMQQKDCLEWLLCSQVKSVLESSVHY